MRRPLLLLLLAFAAAPLWNPSASAAELVMFRRDGCAWCEAFDREIGLIYPKTEIARRAPLRMADWRSGGASIALKSPILYTPTFVLIDNGREVARIEGYAGDHFFWGMVEALLRKLPVENATLPAKP